MIPLEDTYLDIIKKAAVGHGLGEKKIAELSQVPISKITKFFNGSYCVSTLQAIAPILNLDFQSLKAHAEGYSQPPKILVECLLQYQSTFTYRPNQTLSVNHYLLIDASTQTALLFDTGTDATDTLQYLKSNSLSLSAIFITHQHRDHIWALNQFTEAYPKADIYASQASNESRYSFNRIKANKPQKFGSFEIVAYETTGHTEDGMSFKVTGLSNNIMFVGDALFAHSQGGIYSREAYQNALTINRSNILSQSDDTILAPGHGPLTTVSHEKQNNPFYAKSTNGLHTP